MRGVLLAAAAFCAAAVASEPGRIRSVYTVPGELNGIVGHVQGAACSTQGVYLSHAGGIFKIGWDGRLLAKCMAPVHLGDVGYANGRLYGALALRKPVNGQKGMIRVWDEDLNVCGEKLLDEYVDGCAVIGETIYYGLDLYGNPPHRRCQIGRLSLDFRDLGRVETDQGGQCHYGVQTMATDGRNLFCGYYSFGTPPVTCAWFTPDLTRCGGTPRLSCSEGFGMVPKSLFPSEHPRFFTVNALNGNCHKWHAMTNPPRVRLDFYEFRDGRFFDVTERVPPPPVTRNDFPARAPFVYVDKAARLYRLYLATDRTDPFGVGVQMRTSRDLRIWSTARQILRVPSARDGAPLRAPEMHVYKGKCYLFVTRGDETGTTEIYRAETPEGPFRFWSAPASSGAGTLWLEEGRHFLVSCRADVQEGDGVVEAVELTEDMKGTVGKPVELFRRTQPLEGPFLYRSRKGVLLMLGEIATPKGPTLAVAASAGGRLAGPWGAPQGVLDVGGGHGMLFRTLHGQLMVAFHQPCRPIEKSRMRVCVVDDLGDTLAIR